MRLQRHPSQNPNRRKGPDLWLYLLMLLNGLAWLLLIVGLTLAHYAEPEFNSGLVQYWGLNVDLRWDAAWLALARPMFYGCFALSLLTLVAELWRHRRATDSFHFNLVLLLLFSGGALWLLSDLSAR